MTAFSRARIYAMQKKGLFPESTKIGRSTRWYVDDIQKWVKSLREKEGQLQPAVARVAVDQRPTRIITRTTQYDLILNTSGTFDLVVRSSRVGERKLKEPLPVVPLYTRRVVGGATAQHPAIGSPAKGRPQSPKGLPANLAELKEQYEAGATLDQLAAAHQIGKAKLLRVLHEAGTSIRPPGPRKKNPHRWPQL